MWKITVKGLAGESNVDDKRKLDGIDCQECFSEYFSRKYRDDEGEQSLIGMVSGSKINCNTN